MSVPPPQRDPVPSQREMVDLLSDLSLHATGSGWDRQTSNAAWFLLRYGGTWGNVRASDVADVLDQCADFLKVWPVVEAAPRHRDDSGDDVIGYVPYDEWREPRRLMEAGGVVLVGEALHLLPPGGRAGSLAALLCGADPAGSAVRPVARPRKTGQPWCPGCAAALSEDVTDATGWHPLETS